MNVFYVLLSGRWPTDLADLKNVFSVAYGGGGGGKNSIAWASGNGAPLNFLINQVHKVFWENVLEKHHPPEQKTWMSVEPQALAAASKDSFYAMDRTDADRKRVDLFRDLRNKAKKIVEQKVVFVFPAKWPPGEVGKHAGELASALAQDVYEYLRVAPTGKALPWAFMSLKHEANDPDLLGEFIGYIHSRMLSEKSNLNFVSWKQKSGAILLAGPVGSGKSGVARSFARTQYENLALGDTSVLVEVNLAAMDKSTLERRMRGVAGGAFADVPKGGLSGWFEEADGGVLFLDEFQSVPTEFQAQLLGVLEAVSDDVQIARIGDDKGRKRRRVKIVLGVNESLDVLLENGHLKRDVVFRMRHVVSLPALKDHLGKDSAYRYLNGLLATYRWKSLRSVEDIFPSDGSNVDILPTLFPVFTEDALGVLAQQEWEGNFVELERFIFDLLYECDYRGESVIVEAEHVVQVFRFWGGAVPGRAARDVDDGLADVERRQLTDVQQVLRKSGFVIAKALKGQAYFRSRQTLRNYLRSYVDKLDEDVRKDSRITHFLGLQAKVK
jgi:hypothetical protein